MTSVIHYTNNTHYVGVNDLPKDTVNNIHPRQLGRLLEAQQNLASSIYTLQVRGELSAGITFSTYCGHCSAGPSLEVNCCILSSLPIFATGQGVQGAQSVQGVDVIQGKWGKISMRGDQLEFAYSEADEHFIPSNMDKNGFSTIAIRSVTIDDETLKQADAEWYEFYESLKNYHKSS